MDNTFNLQMEELAKNLKGTTHFVAYRFQAFYWQMLFVYFVEGQKLKKSATDSFSSENGT